MSQRLYILYFSWLFAYREEHDFVCELFERKPFDVHSKNSMPVIVVCLRGQSQNCGGGGFFVVGVVYSIYRAAACVIEQRIVM